MLGDTFKDLPKSTTNQLITKIESLSTHPTHQSVVQTALKEALSSWQDDQTANSLVILGKPIERISQTLQETLITWQPEAWKIVNPLPESIQLTEPSTITAKLKQAFEKQFEQEHSKKRQIVVVPDLSWYFLRCVQGWDGVTYLRDLVIRDQSRFWLIGCNQWTWKYLSYVCQIDAYFEQLQQLPVVNSEELQAWLTPIIEEIAIDFSEDESTKNGQKNQSQSYFERLEDLALGISAVAAQLWLSSLKYLPSETAPIEEENLGKIQPTAVTLPDLPKLTADDRYLLFSLLLHGQINLPCLALSLGEAESIVQSQVQVLLRSGVIWRRQQLLMVNPAHYPRLRWELTHNNFFIEEN
ncbi:MAG: hypothetical protein F6K31_08055 [Symploca sp. SIO2G7]|nr:hypothetical protein [Symploca sp. SIO2G7]